MTFRYDADSNVLWAGERSFPVIVWRHEDIPENYPEMAEFMARHPDYRMNFRQVLVPCENGWMLSVIWGDATYSDNHGRPRRLPFVEEPARTEVGVLEPGDDGGLWGSPLSYVDVENFHRLAACVSRLPSKDWPPPPEDSEDAEALCDFIECLLLERTE